MQATQSRRASGSWRRTGQFAALRYVSRHLEIDAGLAVGDAVEWERGSRWELLRMVEEPSPVKGDTRTTEERERVREVELVPYHAIKRESDATGWPRC